VAQSLTGRRPCQTCRGRGFECLQLSEDTSRFIFPYYPINYFSRVSSPRDEVLLFQQKDPNPFSLVNSPKGALCLSAKSYGCETCSAQTVFAKRSDLARGRSCTQGECREQIARTIRAQICPSSMPAGALFGEWSVLFT